MDKDIDVWKQRNEILHKKVNRQMDEIKKLNENSETIFDLARRVPNKTYRELEKYRDADRQEEAQQIITQQENEELKENQIKESWKDKYDLEHRLRREAEGETTIVKAIGQNSPEMKAAKQKIEELQNSMDRLRKENSELYNRIAELTDYDLQKARESGL